MGKVMPSPLDIDAPKFGDSKVTKLHQFWSQITGLMRSCDINDANSKMQTIIQYVDSPSQQMWRRFNSFLKGNWDAFEREVFEHYPTSAKMIGRKKCLQQLCADARGIEIDEHDRVLMFVRRFRQEAQVLMDKDGPVITNKELVNLLLGNLGEKFSKKLKAVLLLGNQSALVNRTRKHGIGGTFNIWKILDVIEEAAELASSGSADLVESDSADHSRSKSDEEAELTKAELLDWVLDYPFHELMKKAVIKWTQGTMQGTSPSKDETHATLSDDNQGVERSKCHPQKHQNQSRKHRKTGCYFCWQLGHCIDQCWIFKKFVHKGMVIKDSEKRSYHVPAYEILPETFMPSSPPCERIRIWKKRSRASKTESESSITVAEEDETPGRILPGLQTLQKRTMNMQAKPATPQKHLWAEICPELAKIRKKVKRWDQQLEPDARHPNVIDLLSLLGMALEAAQSIAKSGWKAPKKSEKRNRNESKPFKKAADLREHEERSRNNPEPVRNDSRVTGQSISSEQTVPDRLEWLKELLQEFVLQREVESKKDYKIHDQNRPEASVLEPKTRVENPRSLTPASGNSAEREMASRNEQGDQASFQAWRNSYPRIEVNVDYHSQTQNESANVLDSAEIGPQPLGSNLGALRTFENNAESDRGALQINQESPRDLEWLLEVTRRQREPPRRLVTVAELPEPQLQIADRLLGRMTPGSHYITDSFEQFLKSGGTVGELEPVEIVKDSSSIKRVGAIVNHRGKMNCLVDRTCPIVAISEDMAREFNLGWDPDLLIPTVSKYHKPDWSVGLVRHMHFQFRIASVFFQAHIIPNLGYSCILGKPFEKFLLGCMDSLPVEGRVTSKSGIRLTAYPLDVFREIQNILGV